LWPLIVIQVAAVTLAVAYQLNAGLRDGLAAVADFKVRGGLLFAFGAGAMAGGLIPEIAKAVTHRTKQFDRAWLGSALFNAFVYGLVGVEVVVFYSLQTAWFGPGNSLGTLAIKTAVDMFLFSPTLSIPTAVAAYAWRSSGFAWPRLSWRTFLEFYAEKIVPPLILCWVFWIPVLFCVYSLAPDLQFPFSTLAEAAWSMVFVFVTTEAEVTPDWA
jgi:hypothetical protein